MRNLTGKQKVEELRKKMEEKRFQKALVFHDLKRKYLVRFIAKRMLETRHPCVQALFNEDDRESRPNSGMSERWAEWASGDESSGGDVSGNSGSESSVDGVAGGGDKSEKTTGEE